MVLGISLVPAQIVEIKSSTVKNIVGIYGLLGIILVGTGIFIGGGDSLHSYIYITFILELIILCLFFLLYRLFKKVGYSKLINICSICLVIISHLTYVYYIIGSFLYY
jgi:hypothetical protein